MVNGVPVKFALIDVRVPANLAAPDAYTQLTVNVTDLSPAAPAESLEDRYGPPAPRANATEMWSFPHDAPLTVVEPEEDAWRVWHRHLSQHFVFWWHQLASTPIAPEKHAVVKADLRVQRVLSWLPQGFLHDGAHKPLLLGVPCASVVPFELAEDSALRVELNKWWTRTPRATSAGNTASQHAVTTLFVKFWQAILASAVPPAHVATAVWSHYAELFNTLSPSAVPGEDDLVDEAGFHALLLCGLRDAVSSGLEVEAAALLQRLADRVLPSPEEMFIPPVVKLLNPPDASYRGAYSFGVADGLWVYYSEDLSAAIESVLGQDTGNAGEETTLVGDDEDSELIDTAHCCAVRSSLRFPLRTRSSDDTMKPHDLFPVVSAEQAPAESAPASPSRHRRHTRRVSTLVTRTITSDESMSELESAVVAFVHKSRPQESGQSPDWSTDPKPPPEEEVEWGTFQQQDPMATTAPRNRRRVKPTQRLSERRSTLRKKGSMFHWSLQTVDGALNAHDVPPSGIAAPEFIHHGWEGPQTAEDGAAAGVVASHVVSGTLLLPKKPQYAGLLQKRQAQELALKRIGWSVTTMGDVKLRVTNGSEEAVVATTMRCVLAMLLETPLCDGQILFGCLAPYTQPEQLNVRQYAHAVHQDEELPATPRTALRSGEVFRTTCDVFLCVQPQYDAAVRAATLREGAQSLVARVVAFINTTRAANGEVPLFQDDGQHLYVGIVQDPTVGVEQVRRITNSAGSMQLEEAQGEDGMDELNKTMQSRALPLNVKVSNNYLFRARRGRDVARRVAEERSLMSVSPFGNVDESIPPEPAEEDQQPQPVLPVVDSMALAPNSSSQLQPMSQTALADKPAPGLSEPSKYWQVSAAAASPPPPPTVEQVFVKRMYTEARCTSPDDKATKGKAERMQDYSKKKLLQDEDQIRLKDVANDIMQYKPLDEGAVAPLLGAAGSNVDHRPLELREKRRIPSTRRLFKAKADPKK